jgi:MinD-like ATPase involved in chromosome partitioning or flagellar assembly
MLGNEIIGVIPTAAEALIAAQRVGLPIMLYQPNSAAAKAFVEVTKKISACTGWIN